MGIFRYENRYAAPTREQRERYMKGEHEEHVFGKDGEILLVIYDEAAYIKDDAEGVRILFTGTADKAKVQDEIRLILDEHEQKARRPDEFRTGKNC